MLLNVNLPDLTPIDGTGSSIFYTHKFAFISTRYIRGCIFSNVMYGMVIIERVLLGHKFITNGKRLLLFTLLLSIF